MNIVEYSTNIQQYSIFNDTVFNKYLTIFNKYLTIFNKYSTIVNFPSGDLVIHLDRHAKTAELFGEHPNTATDLSLAIESALGAAYEQSSTARPKSQVRGANSPVGAPAASPGRAGRGPRLPHPTTAPQRPPPFCFSPFRGTIGALRGV